MVLTLGSAPSAPGPAFADSGGGAAPGEKARTLRARTSPDPRPPDRLTGSQVRSAPRGCAADECLRSERYRIATQIVTWLPLSARDPAAGFCLVTLSGNVPRPKRAVDDYRKARRLQGVGGTALGGADHVGDLHLQRAAAHPVAHDATAQERRAGRGALVDHQAAPHAARVLRKFHAGRSSAPAAPPRRRPRSRPRRSPSPGAAARGSLPDAPACPSWSTRRPPGAGT